MDTSPPSPLIASLLNKAIYQHLSLEDWLPRSKQPNLSSVTDADMPDACLDLLSKNTHAIIMYLLLQLYMNKNVNLAAHKMEARMSEIKK